MTRIVLPSVWTRSGQGEFEATEGLLDEVIMAFAAGNAEFRRRLLGPDGTPLTYFNVYLDDDPVPRHLRSSTVVGPGATVTIISPMAGG